MSCGVCNIGVMSGEEISKFLDNACGGFAVFIEMSGLSSSVAGRAERKSAAGNYPRAEHSTSQIQYSPVRPHAGRGFSLRLAARAEPHVGRRNYQYVHSLRSLTRALVSPPWPGLFLGALDTTSSERIPSLPVHWVTVAAAPSFPAHTCGYR